ncbi:tetratricopeptide repeat protein [Paludibacterium sp. B53371]|uniref:tetratricopeptide repeat protein n=1 Tax=Paludibacterium sp. B53371 TaxID=2806263 RepID=UPI001C03D9B0|nr:tetratricopeptide repeat protein [Paludibacterium sp. B53371]
MSSSDYRSISPEAQAALAAAWQAQCDGRLQWAGEGYQGLLADWPCWPELHYRFGLWLYQTGQGDYAVQALHQAVALAPHQTAWPNDLGNMLAAQGRHDEAAAAFILALERDARQVQVWRNLGSVLLAAGKAAEARTAFEQALALDPAQAESWNSLGTVYAALGEVLEAARCQCQAYVLPPHDDKAHHILAIAFYVLGRIDEAAEIYRQWLAQEPENPIAAHMLAACTVENVPARASDAYLQMYFDQAADVFDSKMIGTLEYSIPARLDEMLTRHGVGEGLTILDAGCGTGLCGPYLAARARQLVGVDLSARSLALAARKGCYHQLQQVEMVAYLRTLPADSLDLIASADTFIYFGALDELLREMARVLRPGGYLLASAEERFVAGDFGITPSGRYQHAQAYLHQGLESAGMQPVELTQLVVREELALPVDGLLLLAVKR